MTATSRFAACLLSMTLAAGAVSVPQLHASPLGGGGQPNIELSATSLPFGDVHLGGSPILSVTVSNAGSAYLNVSQGITAVGGPQFFLIDPLGPFSVAPGGQVEVSLTFYPSSIGTHEGSLEFHSNDPVDPLVTVALSGNGYEANVASLTGAPDPVWINGSITFTVVLDAPAGPGDVAVSITTSPTARINVPSEVTVPQGGTQAQFQATAGAIPGLETVYAGIGSLYASDEVTIVNPVGVEDAPVSTLWLGPVAPSPVRRTAQIAFGLPSDARVRVGVFDLMGRKVATLADGIFPAGRHQVPWNAATHAGGLYVVRLESLGETRVARAVVTR